MLPSIPLAAVVMLPGLGAAAYLLFHHFMLWAGKPDERLHLLTLAWFVGTFLHVGASFCMRLTQEPTTAVACAHLILALSFLFGLVLYFLAHALAQTQPRAAHRRAFVAYILLMTGVALFTPLMVGDEVYERVETLGLKYLAVREGPLMGAGITYSALFFLWAARHIYRAQSLDRGDRFSLGLGAAISQALVTHEVGLMARLWSGPQLSHYATLSLGVGLTLLLSRRYNQLRYNLQGQVLEQTSALRAALQEAVTAKRLNARLASALQCADDAVAVCNACGELQHANAAMERLCGRAAADHLGKPQPSNPVTARLMALYRDAQVPPHHHWHGQVEVELATGKGVGVLDVSVSPLPVEVGEPALFVAVCRDITQQRQLEAMLINRDRLASLGTLAAGVGHEINNPLAFIIGNLTHLAEVLPPMLDQAPVHDRADVLDMLRDMTAGAERVRTIVRDLKTFTRGDETVETRLDLNLAVAAAVQMTAVQLKHSATVVQRLGNVPAVAGNEAKVCQVVVNLLVNAAQATQSTPGHQHRIEVTTGRDEAGAAFVRVKDNGHGIPEPLLGKIFEPFFTTKPVGVGTGLGLSICHAIVAGMGGQLTVTSQVDEGTALTATFPAIQDGAALAPPARAAVSWLPGGRVLVVDDDPLFCKALKRLLADRDVTVAHNGVAALELLTQDKGYDLILCDVMMPHMDGGQFHAHLQERMPHLLPHVAYMTGGAATPHAARFLAQVPTPPLQKPFAREDVLALLQTRRRVA